jgi:hypothetical protein
MTYIKALSNSPNHGQVMVGDLIKKPPHGLRDGFLFKIKIIYLELSSGW